MSFRNLDNLGTSANFVGHPGFLLRKEINDPELDYVVTSRHIRYEEYYNVDIIE